MASEWFDSVTGTNDYERQSWRDNYNGGRAAGDFTGNVNARLDAERDAYQGATWSGSSAQPSALEFARMGGPSSGLVLHAGHVDGWSGGGGAATNTAGPGASQSSGPGNGVVVSGADSPRRAAGGSGAGTRLSFSGVGPMVPEMDDKATQFMIGGITIYPDTYTSDMQAVEDRWGDAEFLSPAWFASWGISGNDVWNSMDAQHGGPLRTEKVERDVYNAPGVVRDGLIDFAGFLDRRRVENTGRVNRSGDVVFTGGGF